MTSTLFSSLMKHLRYGARLDPARDWIVLITFSAIVLVGIVAWNIWAFDTVAHGGTIGSSKISALPAFDLSSLNAVRVLFVERTAEEMKYKTGVYLFIDPSQ